jgi:hypothetical protein
VMLPKSAQQLRLKPCRLAESQVIMAKAEVGLSAQRIYQDLVARKAYRLLQSGSDESRLRFTSSSGANTLSLLADWDWSEGARFLGQVLRTGRRVSRPLEKTSSLESDTQCRLGRCE